MAATADIPSRGRRRKADEAELSQSPNGATEGNGDANSTDSDSDDDDDMGPSLPVAAPKKKRRRLSYEKLYVAALPSSQRYNKSLMHRDQVCFVTFSPHTDFLITSSLDGFVKFWKKTSGDVEFAKEFKAHQGEITSVTVSADGRSFATAGADNTVKIFDVVSFDLLATIELDDTPRSICWVHSRGASLPRLAVSVSGDPDIRIYDGRGENQKPIDLVKNVHRKPVHAMAYNGKFDCVVSADEGGMVEYWRPSGLFEKPSEVFEMKSSTNLFAFKKAKSMPTSITFSPDGKRWVTFSFPDRKIRVFDFLTGKLYREYDEALETITDMQQTETPAKRFDQIEFGKRLAVERDLDTPLLRPRINTIFDETGNFILYGSISGIKVINMLENRMTKLYGREESFRALHVALYQGQPDKKGIVTVEMAASENPLLQEAEARDAMLVATGAGKVRFFMFTNEADISKSTRDVQNEKPRLVNQAQQDAPAKEAQTASSAVIHTTYGDIVIRLFPDAAPKAVENFVTHARNGYYNGIIFHRVIRKFMIQTGDPLGDGTGGESIWGKDFEDEFSNLTHDKAYTVSMANAGPGTNASQFFITTEKAPWLDNKHTVFGRATHGFDVIHRIENAKTYKEKPEEDIKMINIEVT